MKIKSVLKKKIKKILGVGVYRNVGNREIYEKYKGAERCYILASGPSINSLDLTILKDQFCISVSNFFEHPDIDIINPKFHVFAASHPPITETAFTNWFRRADERLPKNTAILFEQRNKASAEKAFPTRKNYNYAYGGSFPIDFTKPIVSPTTVTHVALELAIYLEIKEIILLGLSAGWHGTGGYKHFYSIEDPSLEYYLKQEGIKVDYSPNPNPPKEDLYSIYRLYQDYEELNKVAESKKLKIYNGDPISNFDVFPKTVVKDIAKK